MVRKEKLDGQVWEETAGSFQKAVKRDQQHQFFTCLTEAIWVATPEPRLCPTRMTSSGVLPVSFSTESRIARESPMISCSVGVPVLSPYPR